MSDFTNGFKLCSCSSENIKFRNQDLFKKIKGELVKISNKKNDKIPIINIWHLSRFVGEQADTMMGSYQFPSKDIGNGLNVEWILLNLNIENCFDFDYTPDEGDSLTISTNVILGPYISFIFKNNEWSIDHYSPFHDETTIICKGIIKEVE